MIFNFFKILNLARGEAKKRKNRAHTIDEGEQIEDPKTKWKNFCT